MKLPANQAAKLMKGAKRTHQQRERELLQIPYHQWVQWQFPKLRTHHAGNQVTAGRGSQIKAMGYQKGFPDYTIWEPFYTDGELLKLGKMLAIGGLVKTGQWTGLAIEFKWGKRKPELEQWEWLLHLQRLGWMVLVLNDLERAQEITWACYGRPGMARVRFE